MSKLMNDVKSRIASAQMPDENKWIAFLLADGSDNFGNNVALSLVPGDQGLSVEQIRDIALGFHFMETINMISCSGLGKRFSASFGRFLSDGRFTRELNLRDERGRYTGTKLSHEGIDLPPCCTFWLATNHSQEKRHSDYDC